jgi:hypothetical protein
MAGPSDSKVQNILPVQALFNVDNSFNTFIGQGQPFIVSATESIGITDVTALDATLYPTLSPVNTGQVTTLDVTSTKLTFNPSTGTLSATIFNGALTGTATATSSIANGVAGNIPYQTAPGITSFVTNGTTGQVLTSNGSSAPTWSNPTASIAITDDTTTNITRYPLFSASTTGSISTEYTSSTKFQFNPSTGVLTATGFSGSGANLTNIPNGALTNSSVTIGSTSISLGSTATTLAGLTSVTSTTFVGALSGNATSATSATTATNAVNIGITDDTSTVTSVYPVFVTNSTGNLPAKTSSTRLSFVPNTGVLSATSFSGAGTGLTGTASSLTAGSATLATNVAGGSANQIVYQTGANTSSFIAAPTVSSTYLQWNGSAFVWASAGGGGGSGTTTYPLTIGTGLSGGSFNGSAAVTIANTGVLSFSGGTTGLTPNTATTGAITLAGTLAVANGGTGVTSSSGVNSVVLRDANGNITTNCLFEGYVSQAASGTTITLVASSAQNYQITGSGGQVIKLPNATTLPNGATFTFNNNQTSGAITVQNNSATTVATINSGGYVTVVLLDNTLAAGSWDRHDSTPSNVSWSTNTLDYPGSITSSTWNGNAVAINRGGTGQTTASAAFNALSPITSTGDLIIGNGTNSATRLAIGTNGYVLTSNGTTATWSASTGGVSSITGTASQITASASTGAVTLSLPSTINVNTSGNASTATNVASGAANQIPYQTGSSTTAFITAPTDGTYLKYNTSGGFTWATVSGGGGTPGGSSGQIQYNNSGSFGGITNITVPSGQTAAKVLPRVVTYTSNGATPAINTDLTDVFIITGQSTAITSFTTNLTGTPVNGQKLWISITGTAAVALTFGASFEASGTVPLPTTTQGTVRLDIGFVWNVATSAWRCIASA